MHVDHLHWEVFHVECKELWLLCDKSDSELISLFDIAPDKALFFHVKVLIFFMDTLSYQNYLL